MLLYSIALKCGGHERMLCLVWSRISFASFFVNNSRVFCVCLVGLGLRWPVGEVVNKREFLASLGREATTRNAVLDACTLALHNNCIPFEPVSILSPSNRLLGLRIRASPSTRLCTTCRLEFIIGLLIWRSIKWFFEPTAVYGNQICNSTLQPSGSWVHLFAHLS